MNAIATMYAMIAKVAQSRPLPDYLLGGIFPRRGSYSALQTQLTRHEIAELSTLFPQRSRRNVVWVSSFADAVRAVDGFSKVAWQCVAVEDAFDVKTGTG